MRISRGLILTSILAFTSMIAGQSVPKTVAVVNGQTITEDDLARTTSGRIRQLTEMREPSQSDASFERARQAIRWDMLNYLIERQLTRAEAARQMISEYDLIQREIERVVELPSRESVEAFTEANRVRMPLINGLSPAEVFSQVRGFLAVQANRVARTAYFEKLSKQYEVKTYLEPVRYDISTEGHPALGAAAVPVTIVEFSDFDCSECGAVAQALETVRKVNSERVRLVYRQLPLAHLHPHAQKAAEAALCAHTQKRFWEFHDALFANQKELNPDDLKKRAASLGLDTASFNTCMDSGTEVRAIDKDIDEAYSAGVIVAPTLFVNGRMLAGSRSAAEIQRIVDEELRRVRPQ